MTITASDMITKLSDSGEDLDMLKYTIVKHLDNDKLDERIYNIPNFEQFANYVFDLDIHGWELSGFRKSKYPRYPDTYSFFVGNVCAEFSRRGHCHSY